MVVNTFFLRLLFICLLNSSQTFCFATSGLGLNLGGVNYWSTAFPFINMFKSAGGWLTECGAWEPQCKDFVGGASSQDTLEQNFLDLDNDGYVKSLPSNSDHKLKFRRVTAILFHGNGGAHPAGRYLVKYDGNGLVEYNLGGKKIASQSRVGRDIVEVTSDDSGVGLWITLSKIDAKNHIRNIRIYPPGGICKSFPTQPASGSVSCAKDDFISFEDLGEKNIFHPAFISDLKEFRSIRYMDWMRTNSTVSQNEGNRAKASDAFWSSDKGVPLEIIFELSKTLSADAWVSVQPDVPLEYVLLLGKLAKAILPISVDLFFEYGNEPWNYAAQFGVNGAEFERKGRLLWPGKKGNSLQFRLNYYALRSVELCTVLKQQNMGVGPNIKCAANGQAASPYVNDLLLNCEFAVENIGQPCAKKFDALAVAPYFGGYLSDPKNQMKVKQWAVNRSGGLSELFKDLLGDETHGSATPSLVQQVIRPISSVNGLEETKRWIASSKKIANKHNLPLIAYEGGQHLVPPIGQEDGLVLDLFLRANRDPRMGKAYLRHLQDWKDLNGDLYMLFGYASKWSKYGAFGLKEFQFESIPTPKWSAVKNFNGSNPCWWLDCAR
jgi:hypothetical protein